MHLKISDSEKLDDYHRVHDSEQRYKNNYYTLKSVNTNLKSQMLEIEEKLKVYLEYKNDEMQDMSKRQSSGRVYSEKVKILNDIQAMIRMHRDVSSSKPVSILKNSRTSGGVDSIINKYSPRNKSPSPIQRIRSPYKY